MVIVCDQRPTCFVLPGSNPTRDSLYQLIYVSRLCFCFIRMYVIFHHNHRRCSNFTSYLACKPAKPVIRHRLPTQDNTTHPFHPPPPVPLPAWPQPIHSLEFAYQTKNGVNILCRPGRGSNPGPLPLHPLPTNWAMGTAGPDHENLVICCSVVSGELFIVDEGLIRIWGTFK